MKNTFNTEDAENAEIIPRQLGFASSMVSAFIYS